MGAASISDGTASVFPVSPFNSGNSGNSGSSGSSGDADARDRGRIGVLLFLAGEVMFFAGLLSAAVVLRASDATWSARQHSLSLGAGAAGTGLLLASSLVVSLAVSRARRDPASSPNFAFLVAAVLGAAFLGLQAFEYRELLGAGVRWTSGVFGSCFFVLTALHGLHVVVGVSWSVVVASLRGPPDRRLARAELASWYWHLVDLVWVALFVFFYVS